MIFVFAAPDTLKIQRRSKLVWCSLGAIQAIAGSFGTLNAGGSPTGILIGNSGLVVKDIAAIFHFESLSCFQITYPNLILPEGSLLRWSIDGLGSGYLTVSIEEL